MFPKYYQTALPSLFYPLPSPNSHSFTTFALILNA